MVVQLLSTEDGFIRGIGGLGVGREVGFMEEDLALGGLLVAGLECREEGGVVTVLGAKEAWASLRSMGSPGSQGSVSLT
jgi:hypothetical protein